MGHDDAKRRKLDDQNAFGASVSPEKSGETSLSPEMASEIKAMMMVHLKNDFHDEMARLASRVAELEGQAKSDRREIEDLQVTVRTLRDNSSETSKELEQKCHRLEQRCSYLERAVQLSVAENGNHNTYIHKKWGYGNSLSNRIPAQHWRDRGLDEEDIGYMQSFIKDLRQKSHGFRTGWQYEDICVGYENGFVVLHDDLLLPDWQEFADALQLCHYTSSGVTTPGVSRKFALSHS